MNRDLFHTQAEKDEVSRIVRDRMRRCDERWDLITQQAMIAQDGAYERAITRLCSGGNPDSIKADLTAEIEEAKARIIPRPRPAKEQQDGQSHHFDGDSVGHNE